MKYYPYKDDGMFCEDDFCWIRDWSFNWVVCLPMDYRFWTDPQDLFKIQEEKVVPIDREKVASIHITKEKTDLFTSAGTQDAFLYQWTCFAKRYKGISSD
jgi:hypothetical protein